MFATVTFWRLAPAVRPLEIQDKLLREMTNRVIDIARAQGILDVIMVEVDPDRLIVVSSYETMEGAVATGPPLLAFLTEHYGDAIELICRSIGRAFEPSDYLSLDRNKSQDWRDDAEAMYANINVYRIDPSIQDPEAFAAFLESVAPEFLTLMSQFNLLDMLVIRTAEDTMMVVRLFSNLGAFDQAMNQAREQYSPNHFGGKIEPVANYRGRTFDATFLLGR